jgi:glycosyltransferase involved in cell wall biosynthesis
MLFGERSKMNILYLTQFFDPEPTFIGMDFVKELISYENHVEVLTGYPNYPEGKIYNGYRLHLRQVEYRDDVKVVRVPLFPSHNRSAIQRIFNYVSFGFSAATIGQFYFKKPDVVFCYNLPTLGLAASLFRLFRRSKVVVTVQDLWPESVMESGMFRNKFLNKILLRKCNRFYKKMDGLIVLSHGFKENLIARGIKSERIEVTHNWCNEKLIRLAQSQKKIEEKPFTILFAGNMGIGQALETIIEAALCLKNQNKNICFRLIGSGVKANELKNRTTELQLNNIEFIPPIPMSEISLEYDKADALLIHLKDTKLFEITIPSKTQAYLYTGKPILCGVRGDAATLVEQAHAGICFEPENVASLVSAAIKMSEMPYEQLVKMGQNGHKYYMEHLCFKKSVEKIDTFFRKVIGK